ncbi:MAG: diguanylate cyclase [Acidobacteria bacterium]|nr:diguanylate cyclase [Acidobacteriota bacterium]
MIGKVLIVEDESLTASLVQRGVEKLLGIPARVAGSFHATKFLLADEGQESFSVALVDLHLPDAPGGEVLDHLLDLGLPCIVFTGEFSDEVREQMIAKEVIDYVVKENASSVDHVVRLIGRIHKNQGIKVLVVDDSRTARAYLRALLRRHQFQVVEAENGEKALEILDKQRDIFLVITDYQMPGMNGFELTKRIREKFDMNRLAIIGLSALGNNLLSARFLKNGANDFINKPFLHEEFYCRVTQNVVLMETIHELEEASVRDALTGLHNRRYFDEASRQFFASMQRGQMDIVVGMADLDFFKRINDTHGHDAGDLVLKGVAKIMSECVRETDILARTGGEEFCVLLVNTAPGGAAAFFERVRAAIEAAEFLFEGEVLKVTASFGVCTQPQPSLSAMVSVADGLLYKAKSQGRNTVVCD